MIKKILILVFFVNVPVILKAQSIKKDSASRADFKKNTLLIDSIYKAFNKEKSVTGKVQIYNRFFENPGNRMADFSRYQAWMQRDLARQYAIINDVKQSERWTNKIQDKRIRSESIRLAAAAYSVSGNKQQSLKMLKPILDSLIGAEGRIVQQDVNAYTNIVEVYAGIRDVADNEKEMVYYLKPLYEVSGKYFPSDISLRLKEPAIEARAQLFYKYAKALSLTGDVKEVAEIIAGAFRLGAVSAAMQPAVQKDFSHLQDFDKYLKEFNANGKADFQRNVNLLLAKTDLNGKVWGATTLKGKYVLLDFWGSWCLPCRFTHPHLKELYNQYKDKGFEIVGISLESSPDLEKAKLAWKKAVEEDKIDWIHLLNNENSKEFDAVKAFGIGVFPTKILLNKEGREIARYSGGLSKELDAKLKELMEP